MNSWRKNKDHYVKIINKICKVQVTIANILFWLFLRVQKCALFYCRRYYQNGDGWL